MKVIGLIIPCYNEEGNLIRLNEIIQALIRKHVDNSLNIKIIFVNDGSSDKTIDEIKSIQDGFENVSYISFSRNFGHQNAIKAGIDNVDADAVITMDADLQHPPEHIFKMIEKGQEGYEVVNMKRLNSEKQSWSKKLTSKWFYKILNYLSYVKIESGTADFRLMDKKIVQELKKWNEENLFYRGIIPWLGFKQYTIEYEPDKRLYGNTKYTFKKMLSFALKGITSFSVKPLRLSIFLGLIFSCIAAFYMIYALAIYVYTDQAIPGWTSVIVSVLFIGGVQLLMLGIIGEYIGKLFIENKRRPKYIIDEINLI